MNVATFETKYSIGDKVWFASTTDVAKQHPCPDCKGTNRWQAIAPSGNEYSFGCPRCSARFQSNHELNLKYTAATGTVQQLTIGSVRLNTEANSYDSGTSYMCRETGVGSGSVYAEDKLFETEAEALVAAEAMAAEKNATAQYIVTRYNQTLEISDYQLDSAMIAEAKEQASAARLLIWNINGLFEQIGEAGDKDAIVELIDDYKKYTWERDKRDAEAVPA
jgi:hypothetical protein